MFASVMALAGLALSVHKYFFTPMSVLVFFILGILFGINDQTIPEHHISHVGFDGPLSLEGRVAATPEITMKGKKTTVSFVLEAHNLFRNGSYYETEGKVQVFLHNPQVSIHFGDRVRLRGRLETPQKNRNPHSFDYAQYLARNGIAKIFRGIGRFSVSRQTEERSNPFISAANRSRIFLKERLAGLFPNPYHELASALILGFRKNIPLEIKDAFIKTGTAHLLAISGVHVSLVAGLFYFLIGFFRVPRAITLLLTICFIMFYTALAGANTPILRAGIMGIAVFLGFLLGEERNIKSAFFFAFFILLAANPSALFSASFQLSFVAVASLIFLLPKFEKTVESAAPEEGMQSLLASKHRGRFSRIVKSLKRSVRQTFLASLAATIGMFPILVWYFNLFSLIGFLANMVAIPVCAAGIATTLIVLMIDMIFPPLAHALAFIPLAFFRFELWLIDYLAKVPVGYFYLPSPPWSFFLFYYGFLIAWLFFSNRPMRAWMRSACLAGVVLTVGLFLAGMSPSRPRFVFFDLGKNDAAFFSFSNGANCLINAGRHFPGDQAYWILRPFLMASGIHKLDGLLLTKMDGWHAGGFRTLSAHVRFKNLWVPRESQKTAAWIKYIQKNSRRLEINSLSNKDRVQFGAGSNHSIETLAASAKEILAFAVDDGESRMLYIASAKAETFKILSQVSDLNYDFVFLPHHEFELSEEEKAFLKRLSPRFIISNERGNISHLRTGLNTLARTAVFFIEETGAVEFYKSRSRWTYKTLLEPSLSLVDRNDRTKKRR
ncbi:MAG: DNA internalization-related competence protein ComEC/Rec2 [Candidatus Omnitrophica bacterium]|nr:DNA internalization-related competence protein ComEC/Rec2 [Candidatus Omnitrophota bacterium]